MDGLCNGEGEGGGGVQLKVGGRFSGECGMAVQMSGGAVQWRVAGLYNGVEELYNGERSAMER